MDPLTPDRHALFNAPQHASSTPLSSLPPSSAFQSSPPTHSTNALLRHDMDIDSDTSSDTIGGVDIGDLDHAGDTIGPAGLSTQEKLQAIAGLLRQYQWSFTRFLEAWVREADKYGRPIILDHRSYITTAHRRSALIQAVDTPVLQQVLDRTTNATTMLFSNTLSSEINNLIRTRYFGKFDATDDIHSIDFTAAFQAVQDTAPTWHHILIALLQNQRAH